MPIRPELRHHYTGPAWRAVRKRILARAEHRCEACGVPNHATVFRVGRWWRDRREHLWRDTIVGPALPDWWFNASVHLVRVVLTIAHLNHTPGDNRDENLAAYCQWCHFAHDQALHVEHARATRQAKKDAARPVLVVATSALLLLCAAATELSAAPAADGALQRLAHDRSLTNRVDAIAAAADGRVQSEEGVERARGDAPGATHLGSAQLAAREQAADGRGMHVQMPGDIFRGHQDRRLSANQVPSSDGGCVKAAGRTPSLSPSQQLRTQRAQRAPRASAIVCDFPVPHAGPYERYGRATGSALRRGAEVDGAPGGTSARTGVGDSSRGPRTSRHGRDSRGAGRAGDGAGADRLLPPPSRTGGNDRRHPAYMARGGSRGARGGDAPGGGEAYPDAGGKRRGRDGRAARWAQARRRGDGRRGPAAQTAAARGRVAVSILPRPHAAGGGAEARYFAAGGVAA